MDTSKNSYTILFAIAMVFVVGALLAGISATLRPQISVNKEKEKQQNILFAMNISDPEDKNKFVPANEAQDLFNQFVGDEQYVIQNGESN